MKIFVVALIAGTIITILAQSSSSHAVLTHGYNESQLVTYTALQMAAFTGIMLIVFNFLHDAAQERERRSKAFRGYYP